MTALPPAALAEALHRNSPRFQPAVTPWHSLAVHGGVLLLWVLLLWAAFQDNSLLAWSVGVVYASYDTVLLLFVAWQTRGLWRDRRGLLRDPSTPSRHAAPGCADATDARHQDVGRPSLGVIIAAHNEAAVLPVTLHALLTQGDRPDQILIADDGSSDGTAQWLRQHCGLGTPEPGQLSIDSPIHPGLRWLRLPHGGKARALNAALPLLDTDIVLTVDADTLLEPGAVAAVRQAFAQEASLAAATGVITPVCAPGLTGRVMEGFQTYEYIRNFLSRHAWAQHNSLLLVSGAFAAFRRQAVIQVGGFDPDCLVEDYELIHRLHRHSHRRGLGWTVRVLGQAQARTEAPSTLMAFLRQRRRWFGGFLQTQYWYRDMVGNPALGTLGTRMLPVKAADTLQPLYGITAFCLLLGFLAVGQYQVVLPALSVIGLKTFIDLIYHLWSVRLYRQWVGDARRASPARALLAALAEPFTFQLLRHTAAAWGWWSVLTGRTHWGAQARGGLAAQARMP
ncbi:MAG: glycosyltransferase [Proteobacteria bacterium]|uniref:glycosyltransferase family 2 protein n=1 Tax=Aquabacterium sp. TaxID=1872578 RepID=UPI0035C69AE8|nr:glycosyltransferase [Pseudomonadota bacterium]